MSLWAKWKRIDVRLRIVILLTGIALELWFISWTNGVDAQRKAAFAQYLIDHQCERISFAGRHAEPYYRCDTGLWLEWELKNKANP